MSDRTPVLVTGVAGFIGFHTAKALIAAGECVVGLDNLSDYYSVDLKRDRLAQLKGDFEFVEADIVDELIVSALFKTHRFERVIHLAAQAGVRYSLEQPALYVQANVAGFLNVLEGCRAAASKHLVYASSSSVYGLNEEMPFSVHSGSDHPVSLYGATKKANEAMAHSYSHLFGLPTTGLRFFTVYGPWGRPDMAPMLFARAIATGEPIKVFNEGRMRRDFTCVDDVVQGVLTVLARPPVANPDWDAVRADPATSRAPYRLYNVGNHEPVELLRFIELMEEAMGKPAQKVMLPLQPGDVVSTYADVEDLARDFDFRPTTSIETGVTRFVEWYCDYYGI